MSKSGLSCPLIDIRTVKAESESMSKANLSGNLSKIKGKKVLIIGDIGVDEYVNGDVTKISPEAPVPIVEAKEEYIRLGLAGNVAQNIKSLGGEALLLSVVGNDEAATSFRDLLKEAQVSPDFLFVDKSRPTTRKLRVLAGSHHVVRVDYEHRRFLEESVENKILAKAKEVMTTIDAVILEDYAKGVISQRLVQELSQIARENDKLLMVDPHRLTPIEYYRGVELFKPNYDEAQILSGVIQDDLHKKEDLINEIIERLVKGYAFDKIVITRGKDGMTYYDGGGIKTVPTVSRPVFDVTGAGDSVIATLALACAAGFSLEDACTLANHAGGIVVSQMGCVPCKFTELEASLA